MRAGEDPFEGSCRLDEPLVDVRGQLVEFRGRHPQRLGSLVRGPAGGQVLAQEGQAFRRAEQVQGQGGQVQVAGPAAAARDRSRRCTSSCAPARTAS